MQHPPTVRLELTRQKISRYCFCIRQILQDDFLSHGQAQKLAQRLTFAGRGLYGRSGAAARRVLFRAIEEGASARPLPPLLRTVLTVWEKLLQAARPRDVVMGSSHGPPIIMNADAMLQPGRGDPGCGASIATPSGFIQHFITACPIHALDWQVGSEVCIAQAECWTQGTAVSTWVDLLANNDAWFFLRQQQRAWRSHQRILFSWRLERHGWFDLAHLGIRVLQGLVGVRSFSLECRRSFIQRARRLGT